MRSSSLKTLEIVVVVTVWRIGDKDGTIRLGDPVRESRRVFSEQVFDKDTWCDNCGVLEASVIRGGSSDNFLWSNRGTRALNLGTSLSYEGASLADIP